MDKADDSILCYDQVLGLPQWLSSRESACNAGDAWDMDSIPGSGRSTGGRHGNPLQYSCLENPTDRGAWWLHSMGCKELDTTKVTEHSTWSNLAEYDRKKKNSGSNKKHCFSHTWRVVQDLYGSSRVIRIPGCFSLLFRHPWHDNSESKMVAASSALM